MLLGLVMQQRTCCWVHDEDSTAQGSVLRAGDKRTMSIHDVWSSEHFRADALIV